MARYREENEKPDKRKIPSLFRAVSRKRDQTFYGYLIDDDNFKFTFFGAHDGDESQFKERTEDKKDFRFTKIDKEDFRLFSEIGISRMGKILADTKLEYEADEYRFNYANLKFKELMGQIR